MSVVLAWADGSHVVMAGDRQATGEDNDRSWQVEKVNRLKVGRDREMLIGTAGSLVATSIARHGLEPPAAPSPRKAVEPVQWWVDLDLERWAWQLGIQLDRLMREHNAVTRDSDGNDSTDYDAVIGFRGHVFEIGNATVVSGRPIAGGRIAGAGNGAHFGLGAATALISEGHDPGTALKRAVEIACIYDPLCGGGIDLQELSS